MSSLPTQCSATQWVKSKVVEGGGGQGRGPYMPCKAFQIRELLAAMLPIGQPSQSVILFVNQSASQDNRYFQFTSLVPEMMNKNKIQ